MAKRFDSFDTLDKSNTPTESSDFDAGASPGLVLIFKNGRPVAKGIPLEGDSLEFGRDHSVFQGNPDLRISRRHVRITYSEHRFYVTDLGSRNGTFVDGSAISANIPTALKVVLRLGDSLFLPAADLRTLQSLGVVLTEGRILGPKMQMLLREVARLAHLGASLHITGESGVGKEGTARIFHLSGPGARGNFVAVNCATIPEGVAERLLFGAKRGAYSGADNDSEGYIQSANGGTLFLDEISELAAPVQAKLLRILETKEVIPVGSTRAVRVSFQLCSATNVDLRTLVARGQLREDLYFRLARPEVAVPALRMRREEIPWLVQQEVDRCAPQLMLHVSYLEACLLRLWPGNVRELVAETRSAIQAAQRSDGSRIDAQHLGESAGMHFPNSMGSDKATTAARKFDRPSLEAALRSTYGNVAAAARLLGIHRTQMRRLIAQYAISAAAFKEHIRS